MQINAIAPHALAARLAIYFGCVIGVAVVMTIFFCFASVLLWGINYGANPVDDSRRARKLARLEQPRADTDARR